MAEVLNLDPSRKRAAIHLDDGEIIRFLKMSREQIAAERVEIEARLAWLERAVPRLGPGLAARIGARKFANYRRDLRRSLRRHQLLMALYTLPKTSRAELIAEVQEAGSMAKTIEHDVTEHEPAEVAALRKRVAERKGRVGMAARLAACDPSVKLTEQEEAELEAWDRAPPVGREEL